MSNDLTRAAIDDALPQGPLWEPETDGDLDLLLDAMADNAAVIMDAISIISDIRNPLKTVILSDLEREYGVPTNTLISEDTRRLRLAEQAYGVDGNGTEDDMQTALRNAGFDVYVYQNDPAVDPAILLQNQFQMVAGGGNAYAGRPDAFAGRVGGELLVNGDIFKTTKVFTSGAGSGLYAGAGHGAGEYEDLLIEKIEYPIPTNTADWPLVFFVGGAVTLGNLNLIVNGGFETGDFTGWSGLFSTIDNTTPASGTYCSRLDGIGIHARIPGATSDPYDVKQSNKYTLKVKNNVTAHSSGSYANVIQFFGNSGFISDTVFVDKTSVTAGYEQTIKTLGALGSGSDVMFPAGTTSITIRQAWEAFSTGTAFMDDVEFGLTSDVITAIDNATVDGTREDEFKSTILKYKPLHAWAALIVTFA